MIYSNKKGKCINPRLEDEENLNEAVPTKSLRFPQTLGKEHPQLAVRERKSDRIENRETRKENNHSNEESKLSQQLNPPSVYSKNKTWYDRRQYGNILRGLICSQLTQFKREKNRIKKTRISQNIGYLIQVMASLINQEKNIEERLENLEQLSMGGYGR